MEIDDLTLGVPSWELVETELNSVGALRTWRDGDDLLTLHYFRAPDPPPFETTDLGAWRGFVRMLAEGEGAGLIEADFVRVAGRRGHTSIVKHPQNPTGFTFVASLLFARHFSLNIECPEHGYTGIRETAVAATLGAAATPGLFARLRGAEPWARDPYDPKHRGSVLRNRADDESWDGAFPDHPLSRARAHRRALIEGIRLP